MSGSFIEKAFVDWARKRFQGADGDFAGELSTAAKERVATVEVWAPIANMEVEEGFDFGPVRIEPITAAVLERLRGKLAPWPEHEHQVAALFDKLRREIQGCAAVVTSATAEPEFAQEHGLRLSQDAVNLLRFLSPSSAMSFVFSPIALSGAEYIPTFKLIVAHDNGFILNEKILPERIGHWRVSKQQIAKLEAGLLGRVGSLVALDGLDEFALAVRESLLTYSKATTLVDPFDRLRNTISALEGVLLLHEMEPRVHCVANRMSLILGRSNEDREIVKQTVRQVYWLQEQPHRAKIGRREDEVILTFTSYAYDVLRTALVNSCDFRMKAHFLTELDRTSAATSR